MKAKQHLLFLLVLILPGMKSLAQIPTVELNKKYYQFNNGAKLPAQTNFMVNTPIGPKISMVALQIHEKGENSNEPLYETTWEKNGENVFVANLMVHYKLRQNSDYGFKFIYYRSISPAERQQVTEALLQTCYSSLQANINERRSKYKLQNNPKEIYDYLNYALKESLKYYKQRKQFNDSEGFSELIYAQLKNTTRNDISAGLDSVANIEALKNQIAAEARVIVNTYDYVVDEAYDISAYSTEKLSSALALNIGYGGIYSKGSIDDLEYYDAPYAGISFSLGNKAFTSRFWSNTSLSAGVFLKNFKPNPETEISGPIADLPLYAALGHKVFNYFKINAGATVLEERNLVSGNKSIYVRPFVGLSLEMYLWLGFNKKN